ncbi:MAG: hypothetical protein WAU03_03815 [Candidatus Saccharimonas aalborgensis]
MTPYEAWYSAWREFERGKRQSRAIDTFAYSLEENLHSLVYDIATRTYRHDGYQYVSVYEKKRRDLAVASVRDRVVHRYVYDRLVARYDSSFDPDVWSCRTAKGLHGALQRTQDLLGKHAGSYVWRADIMKFFYHVQHAARCALCASSGRELSARLAWFVA